MSVPRAIRVSGWGRSAAVPGLAGAVEPVDLLRPVERGREPAELTR